MSCEIDIIMIGQRKKEVLTIKKRKKEVKIWIYFKICENHWSEIQNPKIQILGNIKFHKTMEIMIIKAYYCGGYKYAINISSLTIYESNMHQ